MDKKSWEVVVVGPLQDGLVVHFPAGWPCCPLPTAGSTCCWPTAPYPCCWPTAGWTCCGPTSGSTCSQTLSVSPEEAAAWGIGISSLRATSKHNAIRSATKSAKRSDWICPVSMFTHGLWNYMRRVTWNSWTQVNWEQKKVLQQKCIDSWKYMKMFDDGWCRNMRRRIMRKTKTIFSMITHLRIHTERLCEIHQVCAICRWVCFANCYSLFWNPLATVVLLEAVKLLISLQIELWIIQRTSRELWLSVQGVGEDCDEFPAVVIDARATVLSKLLLLHPSISKAFSTSSPKRLALAQSWVSFVMENHYRQTRNNSTSN